MDPITLVLIFVALFALWVAFSPDRLAETLRARFKGTKARAADALDNAVDRMEAAEADANSQLVKANEALIEIKSLRHGIQNRRDVLQAAVLKYQTAAENAASVDREDLVREALVRRVDAERELKQVRDQLDFITAKEEEVQKAVNALNARKADLRRQKVEIKTRAKTAKTTLSVNELLAGVDLTGRNQDVDRAFEIVRDVEAKSGAMSEIAETAMADQRIEQELEELASPRTDLDAEVSALMAKFQDSEG